MLLSCDGRKVKTNSVRRTMRFATSVNRVSVLSCSISSLLLLVDGNVIPKDATMCHGSIPTFDRRLAVNQLTKALLVGVGSFVDIQLISPKCCQALTPLEAEQRYNRYASNYDQLDGGQASSMFGIDEARRQMIQQARGNVLEVGVGTGLNLDKYQKDQISSLTLVDISDAMLQETKAKAATLPNMQNINVRIVKADMTSQLVDLFGAESFDTVIDSFSMCVLGNDGAQRALDQLRRVVRSKENGGQMFLLENSRSSIPFLGLYQDATADIASQAGGKGCVYNQDIGRLIRSSHHLTVVEEIEIAAGLFRSFRIVKNDQLTL